MVKLRILVACFILLPITTTKACGQDASAPKAPTAESSSPIPNRIRIGGNVQAARMVRQVMPRSTMTSLRPTIVGSLPNTPQREQIADAYLGKLRGLVQSDAFTDYVAAVYAKYFSDDDIKALTQFYETPAG
jgi:hypothetical protein